MSAYQPSRAAATDTGSLVLRCLVWRQGRPDRTAARGRFARRCGRAFSRGGRAVLARAASRPPNPQRPPRGRPPGPPVAQGPGAPADGARGAGV